MRGLRSLELGCGLGVPSLAAALAGADGARDRLVADGDRAARGERAPQRRRARDGDRRVGTTPSALVERAPWDLVLAADVLYERRNVDELLELLPRLGNDVLLADPGRPHAKTFFERAAGAWAIEQRGIVYALTPPAASTRCASSTSRFE